MTVYRINGVAHKKTINAKGQEVYDPPLPEHIAKEWSRRKKEHKKNGFTAPKLRTSSTWHAGRGSLIDQLGGDENWAKHIDREHRRRTGKGIGANDVYLSQIAKFPGDPDAVFDGSCSYGDVEKSIEKMAEMKPEPTRLADDLVDELEVKYRQEGDTRPRDELRSEIVEKHGQKADMFSTAV